ncbi:MAG: serine/threonine-protein kinase [Myxococcota bacterium]
MSALAMGTLVADRYEIREVIGAGGMGAVYRAHQTSLGRDVALKVIHSTAAENQHSRDRFLREAHLLASLKHPGIVEIYDFGEHGETLFLAMELLQGRPLRKIVDEELPRLPIEQALHIAAQLAEVLVATAEAGLVHRDLKPENIMLEDDVERPRVVVVDFGLAFTGTADDERVRRLTREGVVSGTPDYMSPEQARGASEVTPASDVYALGVLLFELFTNEVPFYGDTATLLARHLFVQPPRLRDVEPPADIPGVLDDLVYRMLAKDPARRPTPAHVRDTLLGLDPDDDLRVSPASKGSRTVGRAARMLSAPPTMSGDQRLAPATSHRLVWIGDVDDKIELTIAAHGFELVSADSDEDGGLPAADAVFVAGGSPGLVAELVRHGRPVIADGERGDIERLRSLLQAGAAEVVMRPIDPADVARKAARALRKPR